MTIAALATAGAIGFIALVLLFLFIISALRLAGEIIRKEDVDG